VKATGMCWIYAPLLGRIVCGSHNRFAQVGVSDVLSISPKPFVCCGRGEEEGRRELGEQRDRKILSAGIHHDNAMKSRRYAQSAIIFHWR
jgi:hypothetical protein